MVFAVVVVVVAKAAVERRMETVVVARSTRIVGFVTQPDYYQDEHFESFR